LQLAVSEFAGYLQNPSASAPDRISFAVEMCGPLDSPADEKKSEAGPPAAPLKFTVVYSGVDTSFDVTGLQPEREYQLRVRTVSAIGQGDAVSPALPFKTRSYRAPPAPVTKVAETANGGVSLSWEAVPPNPALLQDAPSSGVVR
jgi:hypothetical protein